MPSFAATAPAPYSLTRCLIEEARQGHLNADLRRLIKVVARTCKTIAVAVAVAVGKGALGGVLGEAVAAAGDASIHSQGEAQKAQALMPRAAEA